ncbi:HAD family hydrolase [Halorussus amylolyticus]|uniref:HAD family hydrolase n=1 Tax=Halorussus amylolyticus TaxID=1126242 RepID=UPI0010515006|nr:HAD family hydrolase [Halorussus amylolyticus]
MRAVFFDLDGTLVELPDDFADLFHDAMADVGVSTDDDHHEFYTEAFLEYFEECHPEPYRAAMADLCEEFGFVPDFDELAAAYVETEVARTELRPGARDVLSAFDAPLGVLTNGAENVQRRKLDHHDLADEFDEAVVSGAVGAAKPDSDIFAAAEDAIPADEHVFVADDLERDVVPAQNAGFTGVYVAADPEDGAARADATVSSLREVPNVLE